ncbi:16S rRNA (cytosine(967)-C(5))-methyltransferase RsmB [Pontiella sulfatireligans]|uniref:16S rRNA (cytosine(967)-C(5))-methyltransferase n=1 Tax=Pontiella sulfatireligans TaxID=2750658 RepID=A0A6C2URB5_9BACT|nr:16S rRNA (cytosine(967)-C(5))-methyltransferase RsmB [Pontiella sulfatireligans]VGO22788.1 Ribosomal RNA small subunit methyltransferase B [Pontiella sulfatireligans]
MAKKRNSRLVAAEIIALWMENQSFPDRQLAKVQNDHAFILEVVNGVVRNQNIFQWLERQWLKKSPQPFFRAVLEVGLYQLLFMENVEQYAAISETVDAAKGRPGGPGNAKMINAVLRRAQREGEKVFQLLEKQPAHIRLSHPKYLMDRWTRQYGEAAAIRLAEWDNHPPATVLRIEQSAIDADEFKEKLREGGIEAEVHPFSSYEIFLQLPRGIAVKKVPGYSEGWFTIQDPATSVAVDLLAPRPGEAVLDACAAPGGKAAMMAGRMKGQGELVAMDLHDDRIAVLQENQKRLGLDWMEIVRGDARKPQALDGRTFDAILLDVPCLNTGVLRRRADARWRVDEERIGKIARLQREILDAGAGLLKEGGRLVYSTCSLEAEENEDLVAEWVQEHPEFVLEKTEKSFPPESGVDGAFAALIRRK